MERVQTYVPLQQILSAELNSLQDRALGLKRADTNNDLSALPEGMILREWQFSGDFLTATLNGVDFSLDYRDRIIIVLWRGGTTASVRPGQVNDYLYDNPTLTLQKGYTGLGAKQVDGLNPPTNGNPPVPASGVSWAIQMVANMWLYCHPSDFKLYMYNNTGSTVKDPSMTLFIGGKTGKRP